MHSKREKILIALAVVGVLYGAYALLQPKPGKRGAQSGGRSNSGMQTEFVEWLVRIQGQLTTASITPLQRMAVTRAQQPWPDDLILRAPLPADFLAAEEARLRAAREAAAAREQVIRSQREQEDRARQTEQDLRKRFVFSGYAYQEGATDGTLCAVINGVVYKAGEKLEGSPYVVKSITPDEVVIVSPEQGIEVRIPVSR